MNIFNSLGSNYDLSYIKRALIPTKKDSVKKLESFLTEKYGGEVALFYKGREALTAGLQALGLSENSKIAINGFTCVAVFNAIRKAGFEPVCLDLTDSGGLNFTPEILNKTVKGNKKIKAVVIQNTLGYPCDIKKIEEVCQKNKLILIEDLAHCVGTTYEDGREAGTVGDMVILSFSQDKIIDAVSGGALVVRNSKFKIQNSELQVKRQKDLKDRLYPLLTYKIRKLYPMNLGKPYHFLVKKLGLMSKIMDESFYDYYSLPAWNAAVALDEFSKLDSQLAHRKQIAQIYCDKLPEDMFMFDRQKTSTAINRGSNLRFPIFVEDRVKLLSKLKKSGVYLSDIWYTDVAPECPNAVNDSKIILNLPTHINVSMEDAEKICKIISLAV